MRGPALRCVGIVDYGRSMTWTLFPKDPVDFNPRERYVIEYTARPPMIDAGKVRKVAAQGPDGVRTAQQAIRDGHGRVLRVRSRGWFEWL